MRAFGLSLSSLGHSVHMISQCEAKMKRIAITVKAYLCVFVCVG